MFYSFTLNFAMMINNFALQVDENMDFPSKGRKNVLRSPHCLWDLSALHEKEVAVATVIIKFMKLAKYKTVYRVIFTK